MLRDSAPAGSRWSSNRGPSPREKTQDPCWWNGYPWNQEEVLELTANGVQPMADAKTPLWLRFNAIVDGAALRSCWNDGDDIFSRFFTP
jgi:hypothetical protein